MRIVHEIRVTWRTLIFSPYFTIPVVLSLAVAIGANVAAFSLLNTLVLRTLPLPHPEQLFLVSAAGDSGVAEGANYTWYEQVRNSLTQASTALQFNRMMTVAVNDQVDSVHGQMVSGDYFSTLGVVPLRGRLIGSADVAGGASSRVAVISEPFWTARFGRDPGVLGKTILIEKVPHEIVGVTPADFFGLQIGRRIDVNVPFDAAEYREGWLSMHLVVRLHDRVSPAAVEAQMTGLLREVMKTQSEQQRAARFKRVALEPIPNGLAELRKEYVTPLTALMLIVGTILLLACANWTILLMARTASRKREMAIRLALGSTRMQLARQLLIESLTLALAGATLGFLLAWWGTEGLGRYLPENGLPIDIRIAPDWTVTLFTLAVAITTGTLFGIGPAWLIRQIESRDLRTSGAAGGRRAGVSPTLVVVQVALSLFLIVTATFFAATLRNLRGQPMGFDGSRVLTFTVDANETGLEGEPLRALYQRLLDRLRTLPEAAAVTLATITPLSGNEDGKNMSPPGFVPASPDDLTSQLDTVAPDYFTTFGIRLVRGRRIGAEDLTGSPRVALVSTQAAKHYFGQVDPVGQRLNIGGATPVQVEIIGVVDDVLYRDLRSGSTRVVYVPFTQREPDTQCVVAIRTRGDPDALSRQVRGVIRAVAPDVQVLGVKTLAQQIDERLTDERLLALVSTVFGLLALILAGVGIYGIMAYSVARRTPELGLRIVLGADRRDVLWLVVRSTLGLTALGAAIGLAVAVAASDVFTSILFGVRSTDSRVYVAAVVVLGAVSVLAIMPPLIRALRIQPVTALRAE